MLFLKDASRFLFLRADKNAGFTILVSRDHTVLWALPFPWLASTTARASFLASGQEC